MAFTAGLTLERPDIKDKIDIDYKTYVIRRLQWSIHQEKDHLGRPNAIAHIGQIQLEVHSMPDELLTSWMFEPRKTLDGTIQIMKADTKVTLKTIEFTNAFCVLLKGSFNPGGSNTSLTRSLLISAQQLAVRGQELVKVRNNWPT